MTLNYFKIVNVNPKRNVFGSIYVAKMKDFTAIIKLL